MYFENCTAERKHLAKKPEAKVIEYSKDILQWSQNKKSESSVKDIRRAAHQ